MKALSIRQPWAWLILHAGKDVENRGWSTSVRGRVLVHAAKSRALSFVEYQNALIFAHERRLLLSGKQMPLWREIERGGIVGSVEIVDCVIQSDSPWFEGPFGFLLRNPEPLPFRPCRGSLGFFQIEGVKE